jgi:hypothetical protein
MSCPDCIASKICNKERNSKDCIQFCRAVMNLMKNQNDEPIEDDSPNASRSWRPSND